MRAERGQTANTTRGECGKWCGAGESKLRPRCDQNAAKTTGGMQRKCWKYAASTRERVRRLLVRSAARVRSKCAESAKKVGRIRPPSGLSERERDGDIALRRVAEQCGEVVAEALPIDAASATERRTFRLPSFGKLPDRLRPAECGVGPRVRGSCRREADAGGLAETLTAEPQGFARRRYSLRRGVNAHRHCLDRVSESSTVRP